MCEEVKFKKETKEILDKIEELTPWDKEKLSNYLFFEYGRDDD